jgi:branched-chain amino acid transport system permease protein
MLSAVAIVIMLKAPRGVWGLVADRFGLQIFPLQRRVAPQTGQDATPETIGRTP